LGDDYNKQTVCDHIGLQFFTLIFSDGQEPEPFERPASSASTVPPIKSRVKRRRSALDSSDEDGTSTKMTDDEAEEEQKVDKEKKQTPQQHQQWMPKTVIRKCSK
jgi:hypothetical protein